MKQKISLIAVVIGLTFFLSCNDNQKKKDENKDTRTEHREENHKKDCKDVHWTHHKGENGPENWKNLCDGFSDCGGKSQSPINIVTQDVVKSKDLKALKFNYGKSKIDIINNEHSVQFNVNGKNIVNLNGKDYKLLQFHYHSLSEHTINGKHFPLEVHFVHKHSDTDFAVLGIMFIEGKENKLFKKYLNKFPTEKGEYKTEETIDLLSLFPENKDYYYYNGSFTTPPCSEIVSWYVLKNPIEASTEQIEKFSKILNNNYRPILPINNREIKVFDE